MDCEFVLRDHKNSVSSLDFSAPIHNNSDEIASLLLASGSIDSNIKLYNTKRRRVETQWVHNNDISPTKGILNIEFASNSCLISQARDGSIHMWDIETQKSLIKLDTKSWSFCPFSIIKQESSYNPNNNNNNNNYNNNVKYILTPTSTGHIVQLYETRYQEPILTIDCEKIMSKLIINSKADKNFGMVMTTNLLINEETDDLWILLGGEGGRLLLLNSKNISDAYYIDAIPNVCIMDVVIIRKKKKNMKDSLRCIIASPENELIICKIDLNLGKLTKLSQNSVPLSHPGVSKLCVRNDNKLYAAATWDHNIQLFDCKRNKPLGCLKFHQENVQSLAFAPKVNNSPSYFASGGKDGRIAVYDLY